MNYHGRTVPKTRFMQNVFGMRLRRPLRTEAYSEFTVRVRKDLITPALCSCTGERHDRKQDGCIRLTSQMIASG